MNTHTHFNLYPHLWSPILYHLILNKVLRLPIFFFPKKNNHNCELQTMVLLKPSKHHFQLPLHPNTPTLVRQSQLVSQQVKKKKNTKWRISCQGEEKGNGNGKRKSFLSLEEAGLVEISGLSTHERFLCRLTISSLNLLKVISEQEGLPIEELNAGRVCDWFLKDKLKREQDLDSAVLQWDESDSSDFPT